MQIEANNHQGVFSQISRNDLEELNTRNYGFIYEIEVSLQVQQPPTHRLGLTKTHIFLVPISGGATLTGQSEPILAAKIDFQLKFGVIYAEEDKPQTQKLGLSFSRNFEQYDSLFSPSRDCIQAMRGHLGRYLNQKGFHAQFKPIKKLGKGNFATVYLVARIEDGRKFAVKAFSKANVYNSENGKQSLLNQLSVMRELSSKSRNLLCLDSVYQSDNSIYIVLELLEGKNLFEVIKEKAGQFKLAEVRVIMAGLLHGLQIMSANKIMHRDLKPENIMFRYARMETPQQFEPVIVDFGLAANWEKLPYLFYRCGTPGFVAPEIIKIQQNQIYTPACDMFSIGCIFHLLLTNAAVFPGTKYDQVYKKNKTLEFNIKHEAVSRFHPAAAAILQRMLVADPEVRLTPFEALASPFFGDPAAGRVTYTIKRSEDIEKELPRNQYVSRVSTRAS